MTKSNSQIYREFNDQINNAKRFELIYDYLDPQCVSHYPPYAGLGMVTNESSGDRVVIKEIAPGGPASGRLYEGDEIIHVSDENGEWKTFYEVKSLLWGQGKPGTKLKVTVRREGQIVEVPITRGRVESREVPLPVFLDGWREYLTKEMPDLHTEIDLLIEEGDLVAYLTTNMGTITTYGQSAVWIEAGFARFRDGKIIDMWGTDDSLSQMRQIGFRLVEPVKVKT